MPDKSLAKTIGESIVFQRKLKNLSQKELAAKLEIAHESLGRIERGVTTPSIDRLQDIATKLDCSIPVLFQVSSKETDERVSAIVESLNVLSDEQQEATINAIFSMIEAVKAKK